MKALAITHHGIEAIASEEIKEILGKNAKNIKTEESAVIFEAKSHLDLCLLCYKAQSLIKVLLLFDEFAFKKQEDIISKAKSIAGKKGFIGIITKKTKFKVKCTRLGKHDFNSIEIEKGIGKHIEGIVDLDNPEITVYVYIYNGRCYIGIDFAGIDLSKRQYRIFTYNDSLKGTMAYSMLRIAKYSKKDFLLCPLCGTGTIPIEAALYATNMPPSYHSKDSFAFTHFRFLKQDFGKFFSGIDRKINLGEKTRIYGYDSMLGYVKAGQKNAKIAGINKAISITRADVEWLDTKAKENEADKIVAVMPEVTERNNKLMEKAYREFFYQSDFVLKKKGIIVIASNAEGLVKKYASEYKMKVIEKIKAMQGMKELDIFIIQK